jgi:hypothetical protein
MGKTFFLFLARLQNWSAPRVDTGIFKFAEARQIGCQRIEQLFLVCLRKVLMLAPYKMRNGKERNLSVWWEAGEPRLPWVHFWLDVA